MEIYRRKYDNKEYFNLGGYIGVEMEIYRRNYNNQKYFTLGGSTGLEMQICRSYNKKNISLWEGLVVFHINLIKKYKICDFTH